MPKTRVLIMGAAGRDFHNFNVVYRNNDAFDVVGFTATQIPDIAGRKYPAALAGKLYPNGIPIYDESDLSHMIKEMKVDQVDFAYSDVPHEYVMHRASIAMAAGANFKLLGYRETRIKSTKPVVAICAVRTGAGKSQTSRRVVQIFRNMGKRVVSIRHPMPYGDLEAQKVQRFASYADLDRHHCTIEEREEYEPHIDLGAVIYAGVDYEAILREAEKEADVIIWDGGNNDFSFYDANLYITVADPHRPGHEVSYHPGETNLRLADVVVINKIETASPEGVAKVRESILACNPSAIVVDAASPIFVQNGEQIRGKRVLVIEDGPTLTHGEMKYGAGVIAARKFGAAMLVDPRPWAVDTIAATFVKYPEVGTLLPAMGYGDKQMKDLETTINTCECDLVISATPIDITRVIKPTKPVLRVGYELQEIGEPNLEEIIRNRLG
ncbi:MAG TPA: cyclic 2,3-diphosphoglycerate synthase [Symbiobacteriaceae bacterium]|jgi:predicted GTPase